MLEHKRRFGLAAPAAAELIERLVDNRFARESGDRAPQQSPAGSRAKPRTTRTARKAPSQPPAAQVSHIEALFKQERLEQVVALSTILTRRYPHSAFGWKALGAALVNLGQFVEALEALQKAVDGSPGDPGALSNLGFALQHQRRPVEAEVSLRLALKYRPQFASAVINLAATVLSQDRYEEAALLYQQGLAIEPTYIPAHSHLAQVHDEQGRLVEAVAGFQKTLALLAASSSDTKVVRFETAQAHAEAAQLD